MSIARPTPVRDRSTRAATIASAACVGRADVADERTRQPRRPEQAGQRLVVEVVRRAFSTYGPL